MDITRDIVAKAIYKNFSKSEWIGFQMAINSVLETFPKIDIYGAHLARGPAVSLGRKSIDKRKGSPLFVIGKQRPKENSHIKLRIEKKEVRESVSSSMGATWDELNSTKFYLLDFPKKEKEFKRFLKRIKRCEEYVFNQTNGSGNQPSNYVLFLEELDRKSEKNIELNPKLKDTERKQLIQARLGQGIFRNGLLSMWGKCCVTGCDCLQVLRASHIKPWRISNNEEKLDCFNGLLLSPNLDALFDKGLISFTDTGDILMSRILSADARKALGCSHGAKVALQPGHAKYMDWHRKNLFVDPTKE